MKKALIVSKKKENGDALAKLIRPFRFDRIEQTDSAQDAKRRVKRTDYDLVLINTPLSHQLGTDLALDLYEPAGADLVILVRNDSLSGVERKLAKLPIFIVTKPISREVFARELRYIINNRSERDRIVRENERLKRKMEGLKYQFRAKLCLMENLSLSEDEAHRYIQKRAMDEQRRPEEVSKAIIEYYQKK